VCAIYLTKDFPSNSWEKWDLDPTAAEIIVAGAGGRRNGRYLSSGDSWRNDMFFQNINERLPIEVLACDKDSSGRNNEFIYLGK